MNKDTEKIHRQTYQTYLEDSNSIIADHVRSTEGLGKKQENYKKMKNDHFKSNKLLFSLNTKMITFLISYGINANGT